MIRRRTLRAWRLAAALGLLSCSPADEPELPGGLGAGIEARLVPLLAPGASVLVPVSACEAPIGPTTEQFAAFRERGGTTMVAITGTLEATVLVRPDGSLVPVGEPEPVLRATRNAPAFAPRAIPFGAGFLYVRCSSNRRQRITEVDVATGSERVIVNDARDCGPLYVPGSTNDKPAAFGRGATPDHVVSAAYVGGQIIVAAAMPNATGSFEYAAVLHTRQVGTPIDAVEVAFVEELSPGVALFLYRTNAMSPWVLGRTDGGDDVSFPPEAIPLAPRGEGAVDERFRSTNDALLLSLADTRSARLLRIPLGAGEAVSTVAESALPQGFAAWQAPYGFGSALASVVTPSPEAPDRRLLDVPVRYAARQIVDVEETAGYATTESATTPCSSRASCRLLGESTLLGVVGQGPTAVAFYALWPWETQRDSSGGQEGFGAILATPLRDRDDEPAFGAGGTDAFGGSTGTAGAGGSGELPQAGNGGAAGTETAGQAGAGGSAPTPVTVLDALVAPYDLVHLAGSLYFSTKGNGGPATGTVARVLSDGSGFTAISATESRPRDLAVDETGLYWTTSGTAPDESDGAVRFATLGATPVLAEYAQNQQRPRSLVANSTSLIWIVGDQNGAVRRMPKSAGNTPLPLFTGRFEGLAADEASAFVGLPLGMSISIIDLGNVSILTGASPVSPLGSLRADGDYLYWAATDGVVQRALKTSGAAVEPVGSVTSHTRGLAIDTAWVYVADGASLVALPKAGGERIVLAVDQGEINGVTTDGAFVYWTSSAGDEAASGAIRKLPRPTP